MPIRRGRDSKGNYWTWGYSSKRYYYTPYNKRSSENARKKAIQVMRGAFYRGYKSSRFSG